MRKILLIVGTRPNFIKLAPIYHTLKDSFCLKICHTGQHYDNNMSESFWNLLELPNPNYLFKIEGANTSRIIETTIIEIKKILVKNTFNLIIVFGDVNATIAGAIAAKSLSIPIMHIEAGLRSFDKSMPEEINRVETDHISNYLMVSEQSGLTNLQKEGINENKIFFVGNIMIETLLLTKNKWKNIQHSKQIAQFVNEKYAIATFHRPENVDSEKDFMKVFSIISELSTHLKIIFPLHPRTKKIMVKLNLLIQNVNTKILITEPLGYFSFINLISNSSVVITDSGGIQEESSFLNIPCVTFRNNTERPVTIASGTNLLMNVNEKNITKKIIKHISHIKNKPYSKIPLWDSKVSQRVKKVICEKV